MTWILEISKAPKCQQWKLSSCFQCTINARRQITTAKRDSIASYWLLWEGCQQVLLSSFCICDAQSDSFEQKPWKRYHSDLESTSTTYYGSSKCWKSCLEQAWFSTLTSTWPNSTQLSSLHKVSKVNWIVNSSHESESRQELVYSFAFLCTCWINFEDERDA